MNHLWGINMRRLIDGIDTVIAKNVMDARIEKGYTRQKLADELGITHQQIQKYEKAINRISASRLKQIADVLEVPVAEFYDEESKLIKLVRTQVAIREIVNIAKGINLRVA